MVERLDQVVCVYKQEGLYILPNQSKIYSEEEAFGYNESLLSLDIYEKYSGQITETIKNIEREKCLGESGIFESQI